ncbi:MAG: aspartyl protease family protein [Blastocatellia bacterium]
MSYTLTFAARHEDDTRLQGISVPATLSFGAETIQLQAKVDSGAEGCIFARAQGERLGLDIESGQPQRFSTAMGGFPTYGHEVTLSVLGIEVIATVYFAADPHFSTNVLGHTGWLNRVRFGLVDYEGRLYLSRYDDPI